MNITEAYNIFNLKPTDSMDDFKKKHKELVKKYHPDINKDPDAQQQMSKVNEAFDLIKKHKDGKQNLNFPTEDITIYKDITFAEAVYGTTVNIKYDRQVHCESCDGTGSKRISNCKECNGTGMSQTIQQTSFGTTISRTTCKACLGRFKEEQCNDCFTLGKVNETVNLNVKIPGGVQPHSRLVLRDKGNFGIQNTPFGPQLIYKDAYLVVNYTPDPNFQIDGTNLNHTIKISFLDSIKGFSKDITLPDNSTITASSNKQSQNNTYMIFPNKGISYKGNLVVKLEVESIPQDKLNQIISILEENV